MAAELEFQMGTQLCICHGRRMRVASAPLGRNTEPSLTTRIFSSVTDDAQTTATGAPSAPVDDMFELRQQMEKATCGDMMPPSGKSIVFDARLPVRKALHILTGYGALSRGMCSQGLRTLCTLCSASAWSRGWHALAEGDSGVL